MPKFFFFWVVTSFKFIKCGSNCNGPSNAPYAQRLDLGWVVVGDVCLGSVHRSASLSTYRTHVLDNGRPSLLPPCPNKLRVKEKFDIKPLPEIALACDKTFVYNDYAIGDTIFERSKDDNKVGLSIDDRCFLEIMDREMFMDESNSWGSHHFHSGHPASDSLIIETRY